MNPAIKWVLYVLLGVSSAFLWNVVAVATGAPAWLHPFGWTAWGARQLNASADWLGEHAAWLYAWASQALSDLVERLGPAFRTTVADMWASLTVVFTMAWHFIKSFWAALREVRYVGALADYVIHPYSLFFLSITVVLLAGMYGIWRFNPHWIQGASATEAIAIVAGTAGRPHSRVRREADVDVS